MVRLARRSVSRFARVQSHRACMQMEAEKGKDAKPVLHHHCQSEKHAQHLKRSTIRQALEPISPKISSEAVGRRHHEDPKDRLKFS